MNSSNKLHGLELSLTIGCKLNCDYCPQKLLMERYYGADKNRARKLSYENFIKILDKICPGATIAFGGMSEPFHNEECADMILYAYNKGFKICLDTTLIGMRESDFEKIKNVDFEEFILHIPDQQGHAKFVITDEFLRLFKLVNEHIAVDYYSCHGTVHDAVKDMIDQDKYAGIQVSGRAGNLRLDDVKDISQRGRIICWHGSEKGLGTWIPVLFPDGSLVLCCQDYGMKHVLGNLFNQSWEEICQGEEYQKIRKGQEDDSVDILCRKCEGAKQYEKLPAIQLKEMVTKKKSGGALEGCSARTIELIDLFASADSICVFGLGKLWRDYFYPEHWQDGLNVTVFSDNNPELSGKQINGIECVRPSELVRYKNLAVVLFIKKADAVISQLEAMGITRYVLIDELYQLGL